MMKKKRSVWTPVEARTKDHIRDFAHRDEIVHLPPVVRIILNVGVLDHEDATSSSSESSLQTTTLSFVALVVDWTHDNSRRPRHFIKNQIAVTIEIDRRSNALSFREVTP